MYTITFTATFQKHLSRQFVKHFPSRGCLGGICHCHRKCLSGNQWLSGALPIQGQIYYIGGCYGEKDVFALARKHCYNDFNNSSREDLEWLLAICWNSVLV